MRQLHHQFYKISRNTRVSINVSQQYVLRASRAPRRPSRLTRCTTINHKHRKRKGHICPAGPGRTAKVQSEKEPARLVIDHILIEYRREVAVSAVTFRCLSPLHLSLFSSISPFPSSSESYSCPRGRPLVTVLRLQVAIENCDHPVSSDTHARLFLKKSFKGYTSTLELTLSPDVIAVRDDMCVMHRSR
ncbi:hypothetical protein EVAR_49952_1 [Eumeta japonica]|uniref:Uncharacterized protein n=1 Tax=Eumeta variegata TaxID=151549 RepID=A0A4C1XXK2_EUMVA|nr:hypothetical protein EVAR_49952_1 [Eumeta japonica]